MRGLLAYPLLLCVGKLTLAAPIESPKCPDYSHYSRQKHEPYSSGVHQLPFQRPSAECRTFVSQDVEDTIARMQSIIKDPDLYRLFENTFPNTLDTAIKWRGYAWADEEERSTFTEEELTFIITGDMYVHFSQPAPVRSSKIQADPLAVTPCGSATRPTKYSPTSPS